jgi:hypothetical protein
MISLILKVKNRLFINNNSESCDFYSSDKEDVFKKNLETQPPTWRYRHKKVEYILNSDSFRTLEFKDIVWNESVVLFGCSQTFGVGLAEDETISVFLSKLIDRPVINMGVPGSSPTFATHNAIILRQGYPKPKAVVNIWSYLNRTAFYHPCWIQHEIVNQNEESYNYQWNKKDSNPIVNGLFLQQMSKIMWEGIPYYEMTTFAHTATHFKCDFVKNIDYARDLIHLGHETAYLIAKKIAENLKI